MEEEVKSGLEPKADRGLVSERHVTSTGRVYYTITRSLPLPLIPAPPAKMRSCLKCRNTFSSTGNFICPKCTEINESQGGIRTFADKRAQNRSSNNRGNS